MSTVIRDAIIPESLSREGLPGGRVDILLDGDVIADITVHGTNTPEVDEVVDAQGFTVLPGLIDTHVHLLGRHDLEKMARAGVTAAAELGTHPDSLVAELRRASGVTSILSAGSAASAPGSTQITYMGFPEDSAVTGPEDAERFVQWRLDAGADLIKVIVEDPHNPTVPGLAPETLRALAGSARRHGLRTIAHVVTAYSFSMGIDAGFDILTHSPIDRPLDTETVQRMAAQGTICSPTLVMMRGVVQARSDAPGPPLSFEHAVESVRRLHAAGVPIVAGTDANDSPGSPSPVEHGVALHDELELLVTAGMTPEAALTAATSGAARALGLDDRGALTAGGRADLVLVDGDPTREIGDTRRHRQVWLAGKPVG